MVEREGKDELRFGTPSVCFESFPLNQANPLDTLRSP